MREPVEQVDHARAVSREDPGQPVVPATGGRPPAHGFPTRALGIAASLRRHFRTSEAWFILLAIGIGVAAGLLSTALGLAAHALQRVLFGLAPSARLSALAEIEPVRLLALPLGGALLGFGVYLWRRDSRTPVDVVEANALHGGRIPLRDSLTVSAETLLSNGTGASVGLEAAYAQLGGGMASLVGQRLKLRRNDLRTLVGAGAGAAIGAAFGAPLTGAFYAFEIVIGAYTPASIAPVAAAALAAALTARALGATPYLIAATSSHDIHTSGYLLYAGLGVLCALVAIVVMRLVARAEATVRRSSIPIPYRPLVGGLLLVPIAWASPHALSAGHGALYVTMGGQVALTTLLFIFVLKVAASIMSLGFGFRGGLFFASLFLGALLGQIFAGLLALVPGVTPLAAADAALVGMAGLAVAVVGGPMTMALLVLEATHDFALTATVLTAVLCSSAVVRERFGYSFSTWRLHLRGEVIRTARDIGWMRSLTAGRLMRPSPATAPPEMSVATFRHLHPLGSTSRVLLQDTAGRYAGIVDTARIHADTGPPDRSISEFAVLKDDALSPGMDINAIMQQFDESEADDLAVIDAHGAILGMVTEKYVRRRYADELDRTQKELFGEI